MRYGNVYNLVRNRPTGTVLRVTFLDRGVLEVSYLLTMIGRRPILLPENGDRDLLNSIGTTQKWGDDGRRSFDLMTTDDFDPEWFAERIYNGLENIEVINPE